MSALSSAVENGHKLDGVRALKILMAVCMLPCILAQSKEATPSWTKLTDRDTLFSLTDYFEGDKGVEVHGSAWGVSNGREYISGFVIETIREGQRERTIRCTWGDVAALKTAAMRYLRITTLPADSDRKCASIQRGMKHAAEQWQKLTYREIGEGWLDVIHELKLLGVLPETKLIAGPRAVVTPKGRSG